ncbi:MAG: hypothetical protein PHV34_14670 [Verrucomicrobiae bacterium]|nr:hypothetical protein [Verrucomicrobiae bacterium]
MNLRVTKEKFYCNGKLTAMGWTVLAVFIVLYMGLKHLTRVRRENYAAASTNMQSMPIPTSRPSATNSPNLPETPLPPPSTPVFLPTKTAPTAPSRQYNQPSFGNLNSSGKILSNDFLPKGTILYATLTSDIVSNNQVSPATATIIHPSIFAHKVRIPVGTQATGRIAPGNLRGRVFVTWDTLIFYEEGRQGWELPIKGIGMTYEENPHSKRWFINGAGLKGFLYDDSTATAFKLATAKAMQDFVKTLQTYITTQNNTVSAGSVVTTTTTMLDSTLQNSGLAAAQAFMDVIASRYSATLQQQNSYVLVPTARFCAIFLDEAVDLTAAAPGRSIQTSNR